VSSCLAFIPTADGRLFEWPLPVTVCSKNLRNGAGGVPSMG